MANKIIRILMAGGFIGAGALLTTMGVLITGTIGYDENATAE